MREALQRIEEGTFGICEECEEPISLQRLKARPVTTYCIQCKTLEERRQKMRGLASVPSLSFAE
ncbi:MAG TPA: TraR/DksA family transcriptional regulator [Syntrophales bacterium]|nr:TraR/DksA family transcriptional regulator [Syntrophales bacterium]